MNIKNCFTLLFLFVISMHISSQEKIAFDDYTINFITVLEFTSDNALNNFLDSIDDNVLSVKRILLAGIDVSANNMNNFQVTRANEKIEPYRYEYIEINEALGFVIRCKKIVRYFYDPIHPDAKKSGYNKGYVRYPAIDTFSENTNICIMTTLLRLLQ